MVRGIQLHVWAREAVGGADAPVLTKVAAIEARANPGSVWVHNEGALAVGMAMTAGADGVVARHIAWLSATGAITVQQNMIAGGSIGLIALDAAGGTENILVQGVTLKAGSHRRSAMAVETTFCR